MVVVVGGSVAVVGAVVAGAVVVGVVVVVVVVGALVVGAAVVVVVVAAVVEVVEESGWASSPVPGDELAQAEAAMVTAKPMTNSRAVDRGEREG